MAKTWRNRSMSLELKGFDELLEKLKEAGKNIDVDGRKVFENAAENMYDSLYEHSTKAGLSNRLIDKIDEEFIERTNYWHYSVGWKKQKPSKGNPIPDTYKVMFYNYGTPAERITRTGASRGQIHPHPKGSHGFIKKAKLAVVQKNKKLYNDYLKSVLGDLKK